MIGIVDEGRRLTDLEAESRGGLMVSIDSRADLVKVLGLCIDLERPMEPAPFITLPEESRDERLLRRLYGRLLGGGEGLDQDTDDSPAPRAPWQNRLQDLEQGSEVGVFDGLILALAMLLDVWDEPVESDTGQVQPALHLLLGLAAPGEEAIELHFARPKAALVLQPGSLLAGFTLGSVVTGTKWVAAAVAQGIPLLWRLPYAAGKQLVDGARQRARTQGARNILWHLGELSADQTATLRKKRCVLIFLHGLFSTDLGTFDGLIDRLYTRDPDAPVSPQQAPAQNRTSSPRRKKRFEITPSDPPPLPSDPWETRLFGLGLPPERREPIVSAGEAVSVPEVSIKEIVDSEIGMVGWPHNTLTGININASQLADAIIKSFGPKGPDPDGPKFTFICHSRGGLVARAAAVELVQANQAWSTVLSEIITFGTPHNGAGIAEHKLSSLGAYFLLSRSTSKVESLLDVLVYLQARTDEGIEQLKPFEATTKERDRSYVDKLFTSERKLKGTDVTNLPPVVAIGGRTNDQVRKLWHMRAAYALMTWLLGTPDHDLVIELDSSTSTRLYPTITRDIYCDHFSYFKPSSPEHDALFDWVVDRIWSHDINTSATWAITDIS